MDKFERLHEILTNATLSSPRSIDSNGKTLFPSAEHDVTWICFQDDNSFGFVLEQSSFLIRDYRDWVNVDYPISEHRILDKLNDHNLLNLTFLSQLLDREKRHAKII